MALQKEKNGTAKANQTGERAGKDAGCRKDREDKMPASTPEEFPVLKRIRDRQHDIYACMSYSVAYGKMLGKQEERRRRKEKKQGG